MRLNGAQLFENIQQIGIRQYSSSAVVIFIMRIINRKGKTQHKSAIKNIPNEQILTKQDIKLKDVVVQGTNMNSGDPNLNRCINFISKIKRLQQQNHMNSIYGKHKEQQATTNTALFKNTAIQNRLKSEQNYNNRINVTFRSHSIKKRSSPHPNSQDKMQVTQQSTIRQKTRQKYYTQASRPQNLAIKQLSPKYRYKLEKYVNILSTKNQMINTFYCGNSPKLTQYSKFRSMTCDNRQESLSLQLSSNLLKTVSENNPMKTQIKYKNAQYLQSEDINQGVSKPKPLQMQQIQIAIKKPKIKICLSYKNEQQKQANPITLHWQSKDIPKYRKSKPDMYLTLSSIKSIKLNEFITN